jgi:hypothetical protein
MRGEFPWNPLEGSLLVTAKKPFNLLRSLPEWESWVFL